VRKFLVPKNQKCTLPLAFKITATHQISNQFPKTKTEEFQNGFKPKVDAADELTATTASAAV
jgi:hypothetical protein